MDTKDIFFSNGFTQQVTNDQWSSVEKKISTMDTEDIFYYSSTDILKELNVELELGEIRLNTNNLETGQEYTFDNTNIILSNKGFDSPKTRGGWRIENSVSKLVIYYSLFEALNNMTIKEIKLHLSDIGIDFYEHRNKIDYIELYISSLAEASDMESYMDSTVDLNFV